MSPELLAKWTVETAGGEVFTGLELADLAWLVYRRFGKDQPVALAAWERLFQRPCTAYDFAVLVETGRERAEREFR